jgi:hypothetical protein
MPIAGFVSGAVRLDSGLFSYTQELDVSSLTSGANSVKITNTSILAALNNASYGDSFTPSVEVTYGNDESGTPITRTTNAASAFIPTTISLADIQSKTTASKDAFFVGNLTSKIGTGALTYSSSNTNVASVNSSTGLVTLTGVGTSTITANLAATATHIAGSASKTISVTEAPLKLSVGAKSLSDSAFMLNATATLAPTYNTNSYTQVGQSLTHGIDSGSPANIVKMSADGNNIVVAGIGGNNAGIVRAYGLENGTWTQTGGDIIGSYVNAGAGYPFGPLSLGANTISMSADGTLLTIIESGYGYQTGSLNVFKYDASKTTEQPNPSLPNYGPTNWARVATMQLTGTKPSAVISADGKTIAVTDGTLRIYKSIDDGTTWTQRGTSITDPAVGIGFSTNVSISANGLSGLVATKPAQTGIVKAQILFFQWIDSHWELFMLGDYSWGNNISTAISADGKVCLVSASNNNNTASITRYAKNGLGVWVIENTLSLYYSIYNISISADGEFVALTRKNYNLSPPTYGDVEVYRWNGTTHDAIISNRSIINRTMEWYGNTEFNAALSSDGTRVCVGGVGKVDVYDLVASNKITYTSSDPAVARVLGLLLIMKTTGAAVITATQSDNTDYDTISVS